MDTHLDVIEDKNDLKDMLVRFMDIFAKPGVTLGWTDVIEHSIDTCDNKPFKILYRRLMQSKKIALEEEVNKMLKSGIITPSCRPYSSPVHLVTKKDGTWRFCIDYRKLNGITRKNAFPLPRIDESLDSLGGNSWFCTLDLQSGYHQVAMLKSDCEKNAFTTHLGLFEWKVMPFG